MNATVCLLALNFAAPLLFGSAGCATVHRHTIERQQSAARDARKRCSFAEHSNPGVRIPAKVGGAAGALIGFPAAFALIPITAPIAGALNSNTFPLVPILVGYEGGETLFGAIAWPFFGWWHLPNVRARADGTTASAIEDTAELSLDGN
jgi:hypothetical protein